MIALKAARIITDPRIAPIADGFILIEGDRIQAVRPVVEAPLPLDCELIDLGAATLMAGMIDTHIHITLSMVRLRTETLEQQLSSDPTTVALRGAANLFEDLASGITTMRSLGDSPDVDVRFRALINAGEFPGPRLQCSYRTFGPTHGTASFITTKVDGTEDWTRVIRENAAGGADWIKLFITEVQHGQEYEAYLRSNYNTVPAYTAEEITAAIDAAHAHDLRVAAHAMGGDAMRAAIRAGIDSIEHANLADLEDVELFLEHGTFLSDPNIQLFFDDDPSYESLTGAKYAWYLDIIGRARENMLVFLPAALEAGVPICLAQDSLHGVLWREAMHLHRTLGASTVEALCAVTCNGARLMGLDDELGTLEPGKIADVIALDGDPLEEIEALGRVLYVMQSGRPSVDLRSGTAVAQLPPRLA